MKKNKILVIKLSALGDFIISLGALQAIRKHHKDDKITLLTTAPFKGIAEKSGYFDEVKVIKRAKFYEIGEWINLIKFFNTGKFERVYDLQCQDRTKIYYHLFSKKPEWVGIVKGSKFFYSNPDWKKLHAFKRNEEILKVAGIEKVPLPDLDWMKSNVSHLIDINGIKKPFVIFIPGCSPKHPEKRWPPLNYGTLGLKLIRDGYNIVIVGSKDDQDSIEKVKQICPQAIDISDMTTFYDIYTLAHESSGIVGNDTGPGHIAALSNKPMVSLFCSRTSTAALSSPVGEGVVGIEADDISDITMNDVYKVFKPL